MTHRSTLSITARASLSDPLPDAGASASLLVLTLPSLYIFPQSPQPKQHLSGYKYKFLLHRDLRNQTKHSLIQK